MDFLTLKTAGTDKHGHRRRNSTGTIYIGTTMSTQDNDATIKCVCVVIRAHMIEAAREQITPERKFDVFKDELRGAEEKVSRQSGGAKGEDAADATNVRSSTNEH